MFGEYKGNIAISVKALQLCQQVKSVKTVRFQVDVL
jgi:hypothetical protein